MNQTSLHSDEDAPVTTYYMYLPSLFGFLFIIAKLPMTLWKQHYQKNILTSIIEGGEKWKRKNKKKQFINDELCLGTEKEVAAQFIEYRKIFTPYYKKFVFCEFLNLVVILVSITVTNWLLNNKFLFYGLDVFSYLNNYQDARYIGSVYLYKVIGALLTSP